MKVALVGLPLSGKTAVFRALTAAGTKAAGTAVNLASTKVHDDRLAWLRDLYKPKKYTPASIDYLDFPGLAFGPDAKGTAAVLSQIRAADALAAVLNGFEAGREPAAELRELISEFALADLAAVEGRIQRIEKELPKPVPDREKLRAEREVLQKGASDLEKGLPPRDPEFLRAAPPFSLLLLKPLVPISNVAEGDLGRDRGGEIAPPHGPAVSLCAKLEAELMEMGEADRMEMMRDFGVPELALPRLVRTTYERAGLLSFFTVGEDEVKAWTIRKGDNAVAAAGKIHTDLARGFIRAEVVSYEDLRALGSMKAAREKGRLRVEGKEYPVRDGDVINVRFSVA